MTGATVLVTNSYQTPAKGLLLKVRHDGGRLLLWLGDNRETFIKASFEDIVKSFNDYWQPKPHGYDINSKYQISGFIFNLPLLSSIDSSEIFDAYLDHSYVLLENDNFSCSYSDYSLWVNQDLQVITDASGTNIDEEYKIAKERNNLIEAQRQLQLSLIEDGKQAIKNNDVAEFISNLNTKLAHDFYGKLRLLEEVLNTGTTLDKTQRNKLLTEVNKLKTKKHEDLILAHKEVRAA